MFSGKVEDWPEFRRVWADLFAELPESVQVQHIRTKVPAADAKRIAGVKTLKEVWKRLERVYGDEELNIVYGDKELNIVNRYFLGNRYRYVIQMQKSVSARLKSSKIGKNRYQ